MAAKKDHNANLNKKVIAVIAQLVNERANKKQGSFFVITKTDLSNKYESLYPDLFSGKKVSIFNKEARTLLCALLELDGAIIIDNNGHIVDYGAKIKKTKILLGHGTRHSAARGISDTKNVLAIISSEEDGRVRIFRDGELAAEINPKTGKSKQFFERIGELFSKPELHVATAGGVASLLLSLNPFVAGIVFTGSWIVTKYGLVSMHYFLSTGKLTVDKERKKIRRHIKKNLKKYE